MQRVNRMQDVARFASYGKMISVVGRKGTLSHRSMIIRRSPILRQLVIGTTPHLRLEIFGDIRTVQAR